MKLKDVRIYKYWDNNHFDPDIVDAFTDIMLQDKPLFFGRLGGTEYWATNFYYNNPNHYDNKDNYTNMISFMRNYSAYFDFENKKENFILYLKKNLMAYENYEYMFYAGQPLINDILNDNDITEGYYDLLQHITNGKTIFCYGFMEGSWEFLHSFKVWGENKKILIVSPFEKSLRYQNERRDKLLINYTFPNFELVTYNTNITYNIAEDTKETLKITTNNWHEELDKMQREISLLDFDIAWLSCASYTAPLGDFIVHTMGKKAIYVGGILNMYFNIYGGRYVSYDNVRNMEYQIHAFENDTVRHVSRMGTNYDGFNAYFG